MTSFQNIEPNRLNALKSTGPKTEARNGGRGEMQFGTD
jgi:hypothetical protein